MPNCRHLFTRKGLHNAATVPVCWRVWEHPSELTPGDCDKCPFALIKVSLDIADHPCAVRWLPPHTTREQPRLSEIIRKSRNE